MAMSTPLSVVHLCAALRSMIAGTHAGEYEQHFPVAFLSTQSSCSAPTFSSLRPPWSLISLTAAHTVNVAQGYDYGYEKRPHRYQIPISLTELFGFGPRGQKRNAQLLALLDQIGEELPLRGFGV